MGIEKACRSTQIAMNFKLQDGDDLFSHIVIGDKTGYHIRRTQKKTTLGAVAPFNFIKIEKFQVISLLDSENIG